MRSVSSSLIVCLVAALVLAGGCGRRRVVVVQGGQYGMPLLVGGSQANFGAVNLQRGFLPDPFSVRVVSGATAGNSVGLANLGIAPVNGGACRGYGTAQPDFIMRFGAPGSYLRFFVTAPGDTTLVINDGAGSWWCSDDDGGNLNPLIEMGNPPSGQYDIWVGSYQAGANIQGVLSISELR